MFVQLSVRARLFILAGTSILAAVLTAAGTFISTEITTAAVERAQLLSNMYDEQFNADMMHDGIRGDAMSAIVIAQGSAQAVANAQGDERDSALKELADHSDTFRKSIAAATDFGKQAGFDTGVGALAQLAEPLDQYISTARKIAETAFTDVAAAEAMRADFQAAFEHLETGMGETDDIIAKERDRLVADAARLQSRLEVIQIAAAMLAALVVLFIGVTTIRAIGPLRDMTDAMAKLAGGDNEVAIPALGRTDEIGSMAKAVQVFKSNAIEKLRLDTQIKADEEHQRRAAESQRKLEEAAGAEVAQVVSAAAAGDLTKRIDTAGKTGFFQKLGEGMNGLLDAVSSGVGEVVNVMSAMAVGDLSKRVNGNYQGELLKLKTDTNATAEKLAQIVGQTVEGMANIKASTTEIASGATDLSSRTEEQVASLEEIAASVRQLNSTVQQSAENAGQASQLAMAARSSAEGGGEVAGAAVKAMGEIEQSSQKISDIVGMIDEIAFQTNLLALNAAVEAARAGEAGRGFAVVAGEVRALAQRSSQASKEIKTLISNSNTQVKQGVELVNKAGTTLGEIVTSVKRVSDIVAEIAAANKEQSASVGEVQEAIGQIEQATQQNAALVEETTAALGSADNQVQGVTDVISFFQSDAVVTARPANTPSAPAKGAKAVQTKLAAKFAKPSVSPAKSSGGKKIAATGTDDGWEEF